MSPCASPEIGRARRRAPRRARALLIDYGRETLVESPLAEITARRGLEAVTSASFDRRPESRNKPGRQPDRGPRDARQVETEDADPVAGVVDDPEPDDEEHDRGRQAAEFL
jgi:hypothetical protein